MKTPFKISLVLFGFFLPIQFLHADPTTELYRAIASNDKDQVTSAVKAGAKLNPDCGPFSICKPLALAAESGSLEIIRLLISLGADPNGRNSYGDTALIYALMKNREDAVSVLVEGGADVNRPNNFGVSPVIGVSSGGNIKLLRQFLDHGGNVNASFENHTTSKAPSRVTALMQAAKGGHIDIVRLLIERGADPCAKDSEGKTALEYASKKSGNETIIKVLREATANKLGQQSAVAPAS